MAETVDIIESQPMDLNDDDKEEVDLIENGSTSTSVYPNGKVVQVTNVSPGATLEQLATLFGFLGTVSDIRLYPSEEDTAVQVKVCYIKYENNEQCGVAQHLTNTVFIDKALIVVPIDREELPEESECQHLIKSINAYAMLATTGYLPCGFPVAEESDVGIPGLPPPPVIMSSADPVEVEEIKKTILVRNIDKEVKSEQLMAFFSGVGEIKYMRLCNTPEEQYAFIEFTGPECVPTALQYNGVIFGGKGLKVDYSRGPIIKPESERIASGRSLHRSSHRDNTVRRPSSVNLRKSRSRSRSSRRRSRSRGRGSKGRSRSPSKPVRTRRSRTRTPPRRKRSPSRSPPPPRRRSRSRSRSRQRRARKSVSRSRTRSPPRRRRPSRSRSRSRDRKRRSRRTPTKSPSPRRRKKSKSKSRSPSRRKSKKSTSKSPDRSKKKSKSRSPSRRKSKKSMSKSPDRSKSKKKRGKDKEKEKERDKDKSREKGKEKDKEKEGSDKEKPDLKSLLDKVYSYEEDQEKKRSSKEKEKEKEKDKEKEREIKKESSPFEKIKKEPSPFEKITVKIEED